MEFPDFIPDDEIEMCIKEWELSGCRVNDMRKVYTVHSVINITSDGSRVLRYDLVAGGLTLSYDSERGGWFKHVSGEL